jgi:hypothetical protein
MRMVVLMFIAFTSSVRLPARVWHALRDGPDTCTQRIYAYQLPLQVCSTSLH